MGIVKREYRRISDADAAAMAAEIDDGEKLSVVGLKRGIGESSVRSAVKRWRERHPVAPTAVPEAESLRSRILILLRDQSFDTMRDLTHALRRPDDNYGEHELMHLIYALGKQGKVAFHEVRNGNTKVLTSIRLRTRPSAGSGPVTKLNGHQNERPDEPSIIPSEPAPTPPVETPVEVVASHPYPQIEALRDRKVKLMAAARLLEAAGQDELALAAIERVETLYSPFEIEVLQYVEEHP